MDWRDIAKLRKLLRYVPETGKLYWLPRSPEDFPNSKHGSVHSCNLWNSKYAGKPAFTAKDSYGYHTGALFDKSVKAHRVVFALHHGRWPLLVDHINGRKSDNTISNLREVDRRENNKNIRRAKNNSSGMTGVWWNARRKNWQAVIQVGGRRIDLGSFKVKQAAVESRLAANKKYGFHENHGVSL